MENNTHALTWEDITPTLIPNTIMQKRMVSDTSGYYKITPISGYVLHDKGRDTEEGLEDNPMQTVLHRGYTKMGTTCSIKYPFDIGTLILENGEIAIYYGERQYFAIPIGSVEGKYIY